MLIVFGTYKLPLAQDFPKSPKTLRMLFKERFQVAKVDYECRLETYLLGSDSLVETMAAVALVRAW